MATKKSPSKAKTNTRKTTRSTSSARTSRAASTRSSATRARTAKTTAATAAKPNKVTREQGGVRRLIGLQQITAGIFLLLAILAGYFIKDTTYSVTVGHLVKDDLLSKSNTVFVPAVHAVFDVNIRWAVVTIMALSAVLPLLWAFRWRRQYELNVDTGVMPQRWLDLAVTTALMVETIALLSGVHDLMTLKLMGGLMVLTCALGWLADRENNQADRSRWYAFGLGTLASALPWLLIAVTAVATYLYGMVRSPWYVYALYGSTLLGFILIALNQRAQYRRANQWKYTVTERNFVALNLLTKAAFAIILIVGLHR